MASPDIDQTGSEVEPGQPLPLGAHAHMSIGQVTDSTTGQPVPVDGTSVVDSDPSETREWLDSLRYVVNSRGGDRASYLLHVIEQ